MRIVLVLIGVAAVGTDTALVTVILAALDEFIDEMAEDQARGGDELVDVFA